MKLVKMYNYFSLKLEYCCSVIEWHCLGLELFECDRSGIGKLINSTKMDRNPVGWCVNVFNYLCGR